MKYVRNYFWGITLIVNSYDSQQETLPRATFL